MLAGSVANGSSLSGAAYVAVSGNLAFTTAFYAGRLTVVDISNPAAPQVIGQSPFASSLLNGSAVAVAGNYAYVVSQNRNVSTSNNDDGTGDSLTILDISVPFAPAIVGTLTNGTALFGAHGVMVSGSYVYVAVQGCLSGQPCPNGNVGNSFVVIDASNPANPTIVASLRNNSLPAPWTGSGALLHACGIAVSGQYAYVTASYGNRLTIIDISDPLHPTIVGSLFNSSQLPVPVDVAVAGGYAYVVNELVSNGRVAVVDVRNPASPQIVGSVAAPALNGAYRIRIRNNFAYVAATYSPSMSVIDISDPANPRLAGSFTSNALLNRTVGIDLDPTSRYAISTSPYLSTETRTLYPPFPLQPGGPAATGTITTIALDPLPIAVTLSSTPAATTTATTALFTFTTNDAVSTVRCQLDNTPPGLCTSPTSQSYGALASGQHTFTLQAIDAAGNTATTTYTWTVSPSAPVDQSLPVVVGSAVVGQTLTVKAGSWSGAPTLGEQWQRCDSSGGNCADIVGATGSSYVLVGADVGSTVRVNETATNTAGSASASTATTAVVSAATLAPTTGLLDTFNRANGGVGTNWSLIKPTGYAVMNIAGNAAVDSSSTAFAWNYWNAASFGPDSEAYVTVSSYGASDVIRIGARVSGAGTSSASGYYVAVSATGAWSILRIDNGGSPITLAAGVTQTLAAGDELAIRIVGSVVSALHYTHATGWAQLLSYDTSHDSTRYTAAGNLALEYKTSSLDDFGGGTIPTASAPVDQSLPVVVGSAVVGQTLTVKAGSWSGAPTLGEQWQRCDSSGGNCADIVGATGSSYVLVGADVGSTVRVNETATNTAGSASASTATTAVVSAATLAPTTGLLDTFNRANGGVGTNWSLIKPTGYAVMNIAGNAAVDSSSTAFAWNYWNAASFGPDSEAYVTVSSYGASDVIRIGARVSGAGTSSASGYYVAVSATGAWSILRIDNGGSPITLAAGVTQTLAAGDELAIRIVGSVVSALHYTHATGWAQLLSYDTSHDSTRYTAAGNLALEYKTSSLDDFGGGTIP